MNSIEVQFSTKTKMKQSLESYCGMYSTISQLPEEWWLKIVNTMTLLKWQNYSTCIRDLPRVFQKIPTMMKTLIEDFDYHSSCLKNSIFLPILLFYGKIKWPILAYYFIVYLSIVLILPVRIPVRNLQNGNCKFR